MVYKARQAQNTAPIRRGRVRAEVLCKRAQFFFRLIRRDSFRSPDSLVLSRTRVQYPVGFRSLRRIENRPNLVAPAGVDIDIQRANLAHVFLGAPVGLWL